MAGPDMISTDRLPVDAAKGQSHEVGFTEALGKPVIQICSTPVSALPFNVRNSFSTAALGGGVDRQVTHVAPCEFTLRVSQGCHVEGADPWKVI